MKKVNVLLPVIVAAVLTVVPAAWADNVQGKIKDVDPAGHSMTLEDGTQLMIPPQVAVRRGQLKPGVTVKASYQEQNGQKVVTATQVTPSK